MIDVRRVPKSCPRGDEPCSSDTRTLRPPPNMILNRPLRKINPPTMRHTNYDPHAPLSETGESMTPAKYAPNQHPRCENSASYNTRELRNTPPAIRKRLLLLGRFFLQRTQTSNCAKFANPTNTPNSPNSTNPLNSPNLPNSLGTSNSPNSPNSPNLAKLAKLAKFPDPPNPRIRRTRRTRQNRGSSKLPNLPNSSN